MRGIALPAVLLLAGVLAGPARAADSTAVPPAAAAPAARAADVSFASFEGIWLYDSTRSDDPAKVLASRGQDREGMRRPGGAGMHRPPGGGPPGMDEGPSGTPGGGSPGEEGGEDDSGYGAGTERRGGEARRAFDRVVHPPGKMVIYVERDRFQVEEDEGAPRLYTIADRLAAMGAKPIEGEATVRLAGGTLEARQPLGRAGAALAESFSLSADGRTLRIRARREGGPAGRPAAVVTRVYTRYEGE